MLLAALPARAQEASAPIPSFAELESVAATIGEIRVVTQNIFDTTDPQEDRLLFKSGQKLSLRAIEETERLLRGYRFLYDVQFRPVAYRNGVVDIEVLTRGHAAARAGAVEDTGNAL